jgi:hypothetical protein
MIRSTDIMQSILTDIHYSMHPADVLVRHTMPGMNIESFRHVEEIIRLGEQAAFETFQEVGLLEHPALTSSNPIPNPTDDDALGNDAAAKSNSSTSSD